MGRKRKFSKLLLFTAMLSTIGAGVLGSVPLSVKAAETEETYTVTFEAYEGNCETESVSVPKGESIILPDASFEGHYLESWVDVTESENVHTFRAVGTAGSKYTPERDLLLYANWKQNEEPEQEMTVTYEARIGDIGYEELETAFANAQAGDTITVLRDCSVSGTLEVTADDISVKSEDAGNPAVISREDGFTGKSYGTNTDTVLLAVVGNDFSTQDIIFDGGAVMDGDFNNSGKVWNSPLIYVRGSYTMESGTILQNNYNTDEDDGSRMHHTAGALHVEQGGSLTMDGGLIQNCYTAGAGGGIQTERDSHMAASSGTVRNCYATWGGGMLLEGEAEISGMTVSGNSAGSTGGGIYSEAPFTVADTLIEGNYSAYDGGGICTKTGHRPKIIRCTFTGNVAGRGSAVQTLTGEGTEPLEIHDCTFRGNLSEEKSYAGGTICYMNETGIILSGNIVMEDNLTLGVEPCDILFFYNTGASILLDEDFESGSTFVLGGFPDVIRPGRVLIDGAKYHKDASPEQFPWHCPDYCTEKRGENLYLAEAPKTYSVSYDANNSPTGSSVMCSDPNLYTSEDAVTIMDQEALFPLMGNIVKFGYNFVGWNTEPDGTGTDYAPGQETSLTGNLYLYAKWEAKEPVTLTYVYNDEEGRTDSAQVIPGAGIIFPDASRKGYRFDGWYEDEALTVFAGNAGERHYAPQSDASYYAAGEKTEATVTFDADGGKAVNPIKAAKGDMIRLPKTEKEGYSFLGWYTEKDGGILLGIPGSEMKVFEDMTAYALWEREAAEDNDKNDADPETCKVTFHAGKGSVKVKELIIIKDGSLYLPLPERAGYDFTGWYLDDNLTQFAGAYHDTYRITRDTSFYAKWEKTKEDSSDNGDNTQDGDGSNETLSTYTIKYDANGGKTRTASVKVVKGGSVKLPAAERGGYIFKGWYTDRQVFIGTEGETYKPGRSISLYARWEKTEKDGQGNGAENTNDKDNKNISDKNKNTGGTVSGNSAGSPSDKNSETKAEGGNGNAGKGTEPVIQTGHASPFILLAALGLCGALLAGASVLEGKKICL